MTWQSFEVAALLVDFFTNVFTIVGLAIAGIAYLSVRAQYRRNEFRKKVSATLNYTERRGEEEWLVLGFLYGREVSETFSAEPTLEAYMDAARRTTAANPFVTIKDVVTRRLVLTDLKERLSTTPGIGARVRTYLGREGQRGEITLIGVPSFERFASGDPRAHKNRKWYLTPEELARFQNEAWTKTLKAESDHGERIPWLHVFALIHAGLPVKGFSERAIAEIKAMIHEVRV